MPPCTILLPEVKLYSEPEAKPTTEENSQNEGHEKLVSQIEKLKQKRQREIDNDKKWSEMEDENDELIGRLNRLKPVEPIVTPDPDTAYFDKTDELERERDKYFEEKEMREMAKIKDRPKK